MISYKNILEDCDKNAKTVEDPDTNCVNVKCRGNGSFSVLG